MTDVRFVRTHVNFCLTQYESIEDDPNGTHLLVPVEMVEWELNEDNDIGEDLVNCFASFYAKLCPTCGGSGAAQHMKYPEDCPNCNGRGWRLNDE